MRRKTDCRRRRRMKSWEKAKLTLTLALQRLSSVHMDSGVDWTELSLQMTGDLMRVVVRHGLGCLFLNKSRSCVSWWCQHGEKGRCSFLLSRIQAPAWKKRRGPREMLHRLKPKHRVMCFIVTFLSIFILTHYQFPVIFALWKYPASFCEKFMWKLTARLFIVSSPL